MPKADPEKVVIDDVKKAQGLELKVQEAQTALQRLPEFIEYTKLQKEAQEQTAAIWKGIEKFMIDNDIKSIKGDWGYVTIAERPNFKVDMELLPKKFIKKVADNSKISSAFALMGELPKGVERTVTKYLTKGLK